MPRPAKGKRGKGAGAAVGGHDAADLLERLNSSGLGEKEVLSIIGADKVPCNHLRNPCARNRKENVACFCQLVPAETSYRKKGLWQKEQTYLGTLGSDPSEKQREDATTPAGLRNLGNTCYANAALQCLFSIPSLRAGIYTAEPAVAGHDILRQLQSLFVQMQFGPRRSVDTEALAKTLGLNHAIQQDGQEFLKLLLTRVEQLLSKSSDGAARRLVPQLFRGGLSYVTTCQRCGRDSSSSREVQDFYDLMPQVRGFGSLTTSLASLLHPESLSGDNRYLCDFCGTKVDALRRVRLRQLPPYLCLALQRFYFDPRTFDKAKALDKFAFPLTLDFSQVLAEAAAAEQASAAGAAATMATEATADAGTAGVAEGGGAAPPKGTDAAAEAAAAAVVALETPSYPVEGSPLYELVGILIHKGSQAHSGHYVAHIKDQASGQWWRFDDEVAACIGPDPAAAFQSDHGAVGGAAAAAAAAAGGSSAAAEGGGKGAGTSRKRAAANEDMDYEEEAVAAGEDPGGGAGGEEDDEEEEGGSGGGKPGVRGGRGGKKRARAGSRAGRGSSAGRGGKKGAAAAAGISAESGPGTGRGKGKGAQGRRGGQRGRATSAADADGDASDVEGELRAALAASMVQEQEDEGLRLAMEASMADVAGPGARGGGGAGATAGGAGGAHAGDAEEMALVQMALEESAREAEMAAALAGAATRGGSGAATGAADGSDAGASKGDDGGQQGGARSPMESDAEAVAAAMAVSLADAGAPTPPRLTPPPSLVNALPRPSPLRPLTVKAEVAADDLKGSVHNSPKAGAAPSAAGVKDEGAGKAGGVGGSGSLVSANAYMLVYRAVGLQEPAPAGAAEELPAALQDAVAEAAAAYAGECDVYQRQRDALKAQVEERRRSVREVLTFIAPRLPLGAASQHQHQQQEPEAPLDVTQDDEEKGAGAAAVSASASEPQQQPQQHPDTPGYWVSMPWLELWSNEEGAPPPIDNGPITCAIHSRTGAGACAGGGAGAGGTGGGPGDSQPRGLAGAAGGGGGGSCLDPAKVAAAKLVSREAWERLYAMHGGGPVLAAGDVCRQCLEGSASQALLGNQAQEVRRRVAALLEAGAAAGAEAEWQEVEAEATVDDEQGAAPRSFWVSRLWLQGWSKRQGASVKAEKSPTADLACPHGQLQPARTAKRVAVPADIWRFLRDLWRRQRLAEAQDAAAGKPAPAARGRGRKAAAGPPTGTNGKCSGGAVAGSPSPGAVDCMDLTADDAPGPAAGGSGKAGKHEAVEIDQDDDDDDFEMMDPPQQAAGAAPAADAAGGEVAGAEAGEDGSAGKRLREASAVPPSREGTADVEAPVAPSELGATGEAGSVAAAAKAVHVPSAAELEAMCPELPVGRVFECELCLDAAGQAASAHADNRRQLDAERSALSGLKMETWPQLAPGTQYYMVPTSWVREWQLYVRVMPKGTPAAPRPSSLSGAMLRVLCPCHPDEPRLCVPPPRLAFSKRRTLSQLDLDQDPMRLISKEDWAQLSHLYLPGLDTDIATAAAAAVGNATSAAATSAGAGAGAAAIQGAGAGALNGVHSGKDGNGDSRNVELQHQCQGPQEQEQQQEHGGADEAMVDAAGVSGSAMVAANPARLMAIKRGFTADIAQGEEQQNAASAAAATAAGGRVGGGSIRRRGAASAIAGDTGAETVAVAAVPSVFVWPPVCWEALAAQGRAAREAALVYSEAEVMVELVAAEDLEAAFKDSGAGIERRSRRTRKGRTSITVSNTTTLEQLKLQIFESLSIHPKNQVLYVRGDDGLPRQLDGDELSLAQHEVLPGAELRLVQLRLVDDDDDVAGLFAGREGRANRRQVEEGFKNTALHGDLPPQQAQEKQQAGDRATSDQGGMMDGSGPMGAQVVAVDEDPHVL
ncbi:hypothetical protein HYH02_005753 [Chlamydomonas schloesseri]|uniref:ubiquitinyl hydrolase 1 n=1 Tax=Chlamydomonas schloesseri TaxID=2026947 RepID=A0A835WKM6_9CHLO|nr:hypothetical protein HYH02_005753 [Chlamydomonas schloesseri]|eukprot:KAG2448999.1 hypothetical protein HYH02_005753 [Chlamydomonas schloesseri]